MLIILATCLALCFLIILLSVYLSRCTTCCSCRGSTLRALCWLVYSHRALLPRYASPSPSLSLSLSISLYCVTCPLRQALCCWPQAALKRKCGAAPPLIRPRFQGILRRVGDHPKPGMCIYLPCFCLHRYIHTHRLCLAPSSHVVATAASSRHQDNMSAK